MNKKIMVIKGKDKGKVGTMVDDFGEVVIINIPSIAQEGRNTEISIMKKNIKVI